MKDPSPKQAARRTKLYGDPRALTPLDPNSSYAKVIELLEPGATVLDVSCGGGELDRYLAERGHRVWAVDANPAALESAKPYCVEVRQADLETTDLTEVFGDLRFDAVVFADSLEHLREPWRALQSARELLSEHGTVVASIPNFAHAAVRLAIMSGSMPYRRNGILDDTHLRFFTRAGVESLFLECGFRVQTIARTALPFGAPSDLVPDVGALHVPEPIERMVREYPDSDTLQFVVRAIVVPGPWDAAAMRTHVHDLQARIAEQTIGLGNLERDAAALRERLAAAGHERDALVAERDAAAAERAAAAAERDAFRAERDALREALGDLQARADAAAREAAVRAQTAEAGMQRELDEAARLAAALADAVRERDEATARAEAEAAGAAQLAHDAQGRAAEAASRLRILELRTIESEHRAADLEAALAAEKSARAEAADAARRLETTVRDAALAGCALAGRTPPETGASAVEAVAVLAQAAAGLADALAGARTRLAAADAGAVAARAEAEAARARAAEARTALETEAAGLRSELEAERRRTAAAEAERDALRRREAERETLRRLLDDHEAVAANGAAADGRQLWRLEDAGPASS